MKSAESRVEALSPVLLGLAIGLMLLNLFLRQTGAFPPEFSDETNWYRLLQLTEGGHNPPVSGPLFLYVLQAAREHLSLALPVIFNSMAILGSGLTFALVLSGYRQQLPNTTLIKSAAITLFVTSYFLAPALEARPQQLGIALVFLVCLQVTTRPHTSTRWLLVMLLPLAFWHVFSFFVAIAYLSVWKLICWRRGSATNVAVVLWILLASSLVGLIISSRAYHPLLKDVLANHVVDQFAVVTLLISSVVLATCLVALPVRFWEKGRALCLSRINSTVAVIFLFSATALIIQWQVLPRTALQHYGSSPVTFCTWHAGNAAFGVGYMLGLQSFLRGEVTGLKAFVFGSVILLVLASFAFVASFFLAHNNWMIRILYIWIPFAAPLSAHGLRKLFSDFVKLRHVIFLFLFMASLSHVTRFSMF